MDPIHILLEMYVICLDLEGVLTPEIWEAVATTFKIEKLKLTTRDIPDYDVLMKQRLKILENNNISLKDIQKIIGEIDLLPGALDFLNWLRLNTQVLILTGSFIEFIQPLAKKLNYPLIFCHNLEIDNTGMIINYNLRLKDMKKKTVQALKKLNYNVIAVGDSYNDIRMLKEADFGILFRPSTNIMNEFPQFPVVTEYSELINNISNHLKLN
ncbi:MAG: bifunctional phosphoserine phosphatase/homoserine phosphotransferase ThrH [Candidatus Thorarchaeota archaeon]